MREKNFQQLFGVDWDYGPSGFYRKISKNLDTRKFAVITTKVEQVGFTLE